MELRSLSLTACSACTGDSEPRAGWMARSCRTSAGGGLPFLESEGGLVGVPGPLLVAGGLKQGAQLDGGTQGGLGVGGLQGAGIRVTGAPAVTLGLQQAAEAEQRPRGYLVVAAGGRLLVHPCRTAGLPELLQQGPQAECGRGGGLGVGRVDCVLVGVAGGRVVTGGGGESGELDGGVRCGVLVAGGNCGPVGLPGRGRLAGLLQQVAVA